MGSTRENQQGSGTSHGKRDEAPPPYNEASPLQDAAAAIDPKNPYNGSRDAVESPRPTVESPFNFPPAYASGHTSGLAVEYSDLPEVVPTPVAGYEYSDLPEAFFPTPSNITSIPPPPVFLAIPQIAARATSPFAPAFNAAILLRRGISREAFISFLSTLSAFINAKVSERALTHALDVGRSLNSIPKKFSKDTVAHVKSVGRDVRKSAKKGDVIGAGFNVLGGVVAIPVVAALRVVNATLHQLPAAVGDGLSKKPLSPRERADAYLAVAQKDWFNSRGLKASLCNTAELLLLHAQFCGTSSGSSSENDVAVRNLVNLMHRVWERGPEGQLQALQSEYGFSPLEIVDGKSGKTQCLEVSPGTLWLVLTEAPSEAEELPGDESY
ncbi:hypothetical protein F5X98DRAFT_147798 [Xylaria grammica]|nr:hypothetical protein F5X98DRAFT_147798 [Xylaria grammica]